MKVSQRFLARLKLHALPAYQIAQEAGVNPVTLSKLINGIEPVKRRDSRIIAVGKIIGLVERECFEKTETNSLVPSREV